ncbi:hypothetical protein GSI_08459 [Ganoderma sinense ZZ0214-1]|uniref:Uncharacterized protein n=1 Tax=Ganoderma sinense ZZ0214-1 TaxID=1077348 RepID=A0A2G8S3V9_9APHY|nr:hypothetical protein GSI_08459 [Ganoderma sinense ZZ0214-1]
MHPCLPHSSDLSCRSASFAFRPPPCQRLLLCSSVLSLVALARAGRSSPVFDTHTIPDPTPCEPVRFSWTGGVPPFVLFLGDPDTISIVSEIDDITDSFVTWTPPADTVDMTLVTFVFDDDESYDTTNSFVVQPAACLSVGPPAFPSSSVSAELSVSTDPYVPPSIPPIQSRSSTVSPATPSASSSTSAHIAPSSSSSPAHSQLSNETTSTWPPRNSTAVAHPTTGTPSGTGIETITPSQLHPSTTISHWRFGTSRPRRKPPSESPSPSASEIVGIVLGSVALVGVLVGILVWRRVTVAKRSTAGRGGTSRGSAAGEDSPSVAGLQSSHSTLVQQQVSFVPVSTKAIAHRHRNSAIATSASPTTPLPVGPGLGSGPAPPLVDSEDQDQGGDVVLHVHEDRDAEANSIAVEPSTSYLDDTLIRDSSLIAPPGLPTRASKMEAFLLPGGPTATEPEVEPVPAGIAVREELHWHSPDVDVHHTSTMRDPNTQAEEGVQGGATLGHRARRGTLLESDGVIRLVGGLPGDVTAAVEGEGEGIEHEHSGESIEIVTLPPPYHHCNS